MDKYKEKIAALRTEIEDANQRAETARTELTNVKAELSAKDQEAISLTNRIKLLENQLEKAESGGSDSQNKVRELEAKVDSLEGQVTGLTAENEQLEVSLGDVTSEHQKLNEEFEAAMRTMDDL
ncbi:hypothetical protein BGZ65_006783 [Modicella reniformis]|uniref:Tropomyosin n=1 Tax=Modicella reniformis TaxID=1440133 RepID=A0A9P6INC1_9FUNG|nr:hypothetical protein BGZ65_006783 [Modicella reniformis]